MMQREDTAHAWWSRLRHQGLLLSPVVMVERFPQAPEPAPWHTNRQLRDAFTRFRALTDPIEGGKKDRLEERNILEWLDSLLGRYVGYQNGQLAKRGDIAESLCAVVRIGSRSETLKPHRVVYADRRTPELLPLRLRP